MSNLLRGYIWGIKCNDYLWGSSLGRGFLTTRFAAPLEILRNLSNTSVSTASKYKRIIKKKKLKGQNVDNLLFEIYTGWWISESLSNEMVTCIMNVQPPLT